MRVPFNALNNALLPRLQSLAAAQLTATNQLASGQRVNRPSEDPLAMNRALELEARKKQEQQYFQNAGRAADLGQATYAVLENLHKVATRAGELSTMAGSLSSPAELATYAAELDQLIEQGLALGNTKYQGDSLLASTKTNLQEPFAVDRDPVTNKAVVTRDSGTGEVTSPAYKGASGNGAAISISESETVLPGTTGTENSSVGAFLTNLIDLRDALSGTPPNLSALATVRQQLNSSEDSILAAITRISSVQYRVESAVRQASETFQALDKEFGERVDADYAQISLNLSRSQTAYEAALQSAARVGTLSLLDFLR
jgi:flagellar hook-associated protein 3 FlgL